MEAEEREDAREEGERKRPFVFTRKVRDLEGFVDFRRFAEDINVSNCGI